MGHRAGGDLAAWLRSALSEERREIDRLLAQRHQAMLQELDQLELRRGLQAEAKLGAEAIVEECQQPLVGERGDDEVNFQEEKVVMASSERSGAPHCCDEEQDASPIALSLPSLSVRSERSGPSGAQPVDHGDAASEDRTAAGRSGAGRDERDASQPAPSLPSLPLRSGAHRDEHEKYAIPRSFSCLSGRSGRTECAVKLCQRLGASGDSRQISGSVTSEQAIGWLSWVDLISGVAIFLNILVSALETQYKGFDLECLITQELGCRASKQAWPGMDVFFSTMELAFGVFFITELLIRLALFLKLWRDFWWNILDTLFIIAWLVEVLSGGLGFDPTMLRLIRLIRLMRLARLVANYKVFDPLFLIFKAVQSSLAVLFWTVLLLFVLMMAVGMLIAIMLEGFMSDPDGDAAARLVVFDRWGTFLRAYVSMFELTLANWGPQCWMLMDTVHVAWGLFFIVWRCCFGFAVIPVITSVFIQQTFKVASRDEEIMIKDKAVASGVLLNHLEHLFTELDESGDGRITRAEFDRIVDEPRFKHFFAALEIDVSDVPRVFQALHNGDGDRDGEVTKSEFIDGLRKLKGTAQAIDMLAVTKDLKRLKSLLSRLQGQVLGPKACETALATAGFVRL